MGANQYLRAGSGKEELASPIRSDPIRWKQERKPAQKKPQSALKDIPHSRKIHFYTVNVP